MCTSPVTILNPSRFYKVGYSKNYLSVPCGHCESCRLSLQDEWFVRAFFEFRRVKNLGGDAWFFLLTYSEENVPSYVDDDLNFSCPGFNPAHIKSFRDMLRVYLTRDGYDCSGVNRISFKMCPEYGEDTGHPHWHVLMFIPFSLSDSYLMGHWRKDPESGKYRLMDGLLQKCWKYGFVSWSRDKNTKEFQPRIKSYGGIHYAMKYVSKDSVWTARYGIDEYKRFLVNSIRSLKNNKVLSPSFCIEKLTFYEEKLRVFKRSQPRNYTSCNFGVDGLSAFLSDGSVDVDRFVRGFIDLSEFGMSHDKQTNFNYLIPRYFMKKMLYTNKDGALCLNEYGFEYNVARYFVRKKRLCDLYRLYLSPVKLAPHLRPLKEVDAKRVSELVRYHLGSASVDDLAMFNLVFRNVTLKERHVENLLVPSTVEDMGCVSLQDFHCSDVAYQLQFFRNNEFNFYMSSLVPEYLPAPKGFKPSSVALRCDINHKGFESFECFRSFNKVLELIESYERRLIELVFDAKKNKRKDKEKTLKLPYFGGWFDV